MRQFFCDTIFTVLLFIMLAMMKVALAVAWLLRLGSSGNESDL